MAQVRQRLLSCLPVALLLSLETSAQKFYPDDPIWQEPQPVSVKKPLARKLSEYYDFFWHLFATPGERQPKGKPVRAQNVNTMDEVPDGAWYVNRHGRRPMSLEELVRGPGNSNAPVMSGPWKVVKSKTEGVTPGFTIEDSGGTRYMLKVDPLGYPEMATAADVIGAKFFHALGYHVPENYVVYFSRSGLKVDPQSVLVDVYGKKRRMNERDVDEVLLRVPRDSQGRYRAVASRYLKGRDIGPFRFHGMRKDDPNDTLPHEHRRELRGLSVFCAWLSHNDIKSLNDMDALVEEGGISFIRHYLIDFGAMLGSESFTAKSPRAGNEYFYDARPAFLQILTLGLYVPGWAWAYFPDLPSVGRFESKVFEPEKWKPNYPNPAFLNRLPDDTFWAAKQVMAFRDQEIRALVATGEYSDPQAVDWLTRCLIARRDKIGRTYFAQVLPLDRFRVSTQRLEFDDLAVKYGFAAPRDYAVQWSRFDNRTQQKTVLPGHTGHTLPDAVTQATPGEYFCAEIRGAEAGKTVAVYLRRHNTGVEVIGTERSWAR